MVALAKSTPPTAGLGLECSVDSCTVVIFGALGDLTRRKLVPALYNLRHDGLLPGKVSVVGVGRRPIDHADLVRTLGEGIEAHSRNPYDAGAWEQLASSISYCVPDPSGYERLVEHLERIEAQGTRGNRLYYLATPPSAFPGIVKELGRAGLNRPGQSGSWARVVLEKPIGHDSASANELNRVVNGVFHEKDVYRIDHYLGKETVQNLLVFRFANAIFEPLWNQKYVDNVQITVAESIGVGSRGKYYEEAGTTRDMVQNHMLQLVCLTAMEPPVSLAPDAIRDEKVKVLQALRPIQPEDVERATVRGQYAGGVVDGEQVIGYKNEEGVSKDSRTETYVAARLHVDNWRWAGVPFYLRAAKRMPKRLTEIALEFKDVPHRLFQVGRLESNTLTLRIQPDEGIAIKFDTKVPGTAPRIQPVRMNFGYGGAFGGPSPEAYERLLIDAILGDSTLFIRRDEVQASWAYIDRLHEQWSREQTDTPLPEYTAGTWGPAEADIMLAQDKRKWRRL